MRACDDGGRGRIQFAEECGAQGISNSVYTAQVAASALGQITIHNRVSESLKFQACFHFIFISEAPSHRGRVVGHPESTVRAEEDNAAAATEAVVEI